MDSKHTFKHLQTLFKDSNSCQELRTRIFCNRQNWNVTRSHNPTLEMDTSADQIYFFSSLWLSPFLCLGGWFFLLFINLFFFLSSVWVVWSVFSQGHHWANCCDKGGCLVTPTWSASSFSLSGSSLALSVAQDSLSFFLSLSLCFHMQLFLCSRFLFC